MGNESSRGLSHNVKVLMAPSRIGVAIGKAGANAKDIETQTGLKLVTPSKDAAADANGLVPIHFRGEGDQLAAATLIEKTISDSVTVLELELSAEQRGLLESKAKIESLAQQTNTKMAYLSDKPSGEKRLEIAGKADHVSQAFSNLRRLLDIQPSFHEARMSGDTNLLERNLKTGSIGAASPKVSHARSLPQTSKGLSSTPIPVGTNSGSFTRSPVTESRRLNFQSRNDREGTSLNTGVSYVSISSSIGSSYQSSSFHSRSLAGSVGNRSFARAPSSKGDYTYEDNEEGTKMTIEKAKIGYVIGRQTDRFQNETELTINIGSTINRIKVESGASIEVDSKACVITLAGEPPAIQKAKEMLELLLNESKSSNDKRNIFFEGITSVEHQVQFVPYTGPCSGKLKNEQIFVLGSSSVSEEDSEETLQPILDHNNTKFLDVCIPVIQSMIGQGSVISVSALVGRLIFYKVPSSIQGRTLTIESVSSKLKTGDIRSRFEATDSAADLPWLRELVQTSTSTGYSLTMGITSEKDTQSSRQRVKTSRMIFKPNKESPTGLEDFVDTQDSHELTADFVNLRNKHDVRIIVKYATHPFPQQYEDFCKSMRLDHETESLNYDTEGNIRVFASRLLSIQSFAAQDSTRPVVIQSQTTKKTVNSAVPPPGNEEDNEVHRELQLYSDDLDRLFQASNFQADRIAEVRSLLVEFLTSVRSLVS